jgi:hypothetical protein
MVEGYRGRQTSVFDDMHSGPPLTVICVEMKEFNNRIRYNRTISSNENLS